MTGARFFEYVGVVIAYSGIALAFAIPIVLAMLIVQWAAARWGGEHWLRWATRVGQLLFVGLIFYYWVNAHPWQSHDFKHAGSTTQAAAALMVMLWCIAFASIGRRFMGRGSDRDNSGPTSA